MAVRQTRLGQLPMDDPLQVHRELAVGQGDTVGENVLPQPLDHGGGDIIVGLKAAGTNPGTDGGQDVPGVTAVKGGHLGHRLGGNAQRGSPPAGVHRGNGPVHRVVQEHGNTVGVVDGQAEAGLVGEQAVRLVVQGVQQVVQHIGPGGLADGILVDLVGHNQAGDIGADGGAEPVIVLPDCRPFVGAGDAQVQLSIGTGADAAQPGGEAVGHPAGGGKGVRRVEDDAVSGLLGK